MALLGWLDRVAGRINKLFGGTAVASATEEGGFPGPSTTNAAGVVTVLGEVEKETAEEQRAEEE